MRGEKETYFPTPPPPPKKKVLTRQRERESSFNLQSFNNNENFSESTQILTQQIQAEPTNHKTPPIIVYKALEKFSFLRLPGKKKKKNLQF
jgi:hypothetical protein